MMREHIKPETIEAIKAGTPTIEEKIAFFEHVESCEQCALALAESYERSELVSFSPDFETMFYKKLRKSQLTEPIRKREKRSVRREFYLYSFKVCVAASIAFTLLFSGTLDYGVSMGRSLHGDLSGVNKITESLRGFSDRLIDFKVTTDLKEVL